MRFIVYGVGAIGGVIASRLFQSGHQVVLIARGAHFDAIRRSGLRLETPTATAVLPIPVVDHPGAVEWTSDDVVLLAMKGQDTPDAVSALARVAPPATPIFCAQNGVENERTALRWFSRVYGVAVVFPASHLEPGVVQAFSSPLTGLLDLGRWPRGTDEVAAAAAAALTASTFNSRAIPDIARWKYAKLLSNLGNACEAICGPSARRGQLSDLTRREGEACLRAAGIDFASAAEDAERRGDLLSRQPVAGQARGGSSSWQSLARRAGSIETDYLNGEIALLGRLYDVPTPLNALLCRLANEMARRGTPPGGMTPEEVLAQLDHATSMST
ncbi:MAG TPA: 2-dehydropantoate 2-reductase N-terminal domain-containing protein [Ktedonobacterales bacterium]